MANDAPQLQLTDLPVTDGHCHLFAVRPPTDDLCSALSMSLHGMPPAQLRHTLVYRRALQELRLLLGVGGSDEDILAARQERLQRDYQAYVRALLHDARLQTLVIDLGYRPAAVDLGEFEKLVPIEALYLYRIEEAVDSLWSLVDSGELRLEQAEESFRHGLLKAISAPRVVGLKSIIGYRTGLDVQPLARGDLTHARPSEKRFRDYLLLRAIEIAAERELPVQLHAAFGESNIDLLKNNPALLKPLLDTPQASGCRIVIVHGGYPRSFEAGYLAAVYPNVYVDLSAMVPFVPLGAWQGFSDILGMCPLNKVTFGSDGYVTPEIHWLGAKLAKEILASLLSRLIQQGMLEENYAREVAKMVMCDTARKLYARPT